ncbi:hypothetical protein [Bradyrhizobium vignae]|uniref:Uncharacterized protein n=1 Tax=Bradyrhizobium vignae TaxID=1549949 RepID=A0A2U3PVW0_9BRAD|nr:hypothetical protein [Bradyrhizobium vignae]SPP93283.1 protein of unknown function [Bradyrhizobium vignae]
MRGEAATEIKKLEAEAARLLKRRLRHEAEAGQLAKDEKAHDEAVEATILSSLREAGLTKLPLTQVLATIRALGAEAAAKDIPRNRALEATERASGGSLYGSEDAAVREVFVKISRNVSADNRAIIDDAGLGWNGKLGGWKGRVDSTAIEKLQNHFVDRVVILGEQEPPSQAGSADESTPPAPLGPDSSSDALATPAEDEGVDLGSMPEAGMIVGAATPPADDAYDNPDAAVVTSAGDAVARPAAPPRFGAFPRPLARLSQVDEEPDRPPGL